MVAKMPKSVTKPDAWIVTNNQKDKSKPSDRGRKSIKNGKVYLENGENFEIELYNPLQECVLCDIKLNGQSISKSGLVLKPGQRFYLDCFIDDKKKFIFNTYEIESSLESISATQKNGLLEVFFYKESIVTIDNWKEKIIYYPVHHYYPYYNPYYYPYRGGIYYGTGTSGLIGGNTFTSNDCTYGSSTTNVNIGSVNNNSTYSSDFVVNTSNSLSLNNIETGRVEKGSSSSQKFTEIDMEFESNFISSTILHLLPNSQKPVETKEITKESKPDIKSILKQEAIEVIDLIKKLGDLHTAGILTDDEFNTKKAELLSKI